MKKFGILIFLLALLIPATGQEPVKEKSEKNNFQVIPDTNENVKVVIGDKIASIENSSNAVKVRVGDRGLNILESLEGPKFAVEKFPRHENESDNDDEEDHQARRRHRFTGHWAGLEFGFNNWLTSENSTVMPTDISYMNLHSSKSNNFNLNFSQLSIGFSRHIGIVTGLGINWNNYRFDGNFNIQKRPDGTIDSISPIESLKKSKLSTVYLTLPVLLEAQIPANYHRINIAAGFIGALKLGSYSKIVFENGDNIKSNSDFNLNMLRYGATARIGYQNFQLYGTYYLTPLFKTGHGPGGYDLYPFEIGFSLSFND